MYVCMCEEKKPRNVNTLSGSQKEDPRQEMAWKSSVSEGTSILGTGNKRCSLQFFESYLAWRLPEMKMPGNPSYLTVMQNHNGPIWFEY